MPYKDKRDQNKCAREWYARNKNKHYQNTRKVKMRHLAAWKRFKSKVACSNCGFKHPAAIDFHHVVRGPGQESINRLISQGRFAAAYKELERCIPLCANCHRILHYKEEKGVQ